MTDVQPTRGRDIVAQLSPGDMLGSKGKAAVRALPLDAALDLGTVVMEVRGLSYRHNPQDDTKPSIALVGPVKFIPSDPERNEIWSGRAFLPSALHDAIVVSLQGENKAPVDKSPTRKEKPIEVQLGYTLPVVAEIAAISKPETAVGYVYATQTSAKVPLQMQDPLAALTELAGMKAIAGPKPVPATTAIAGLKPAPAITAKVGKRKGR